MGAEPAEIYYLYADRLEVQVGEAPRQAVPGPPLEALRERVESIDAPPGSLPFTGGFVGYFGWDLIRLLEHLPDQPDDPFELPVALLLRFDNVVVFDHARQRVVVVANEIEGERSAAVCRGEARGIEPGSAPAHRERRAGHCPRTHRRRFVPPSRA